MLGQVPWENLMFRLSFFAALNPFKIYHLQILPSRPWVLDKES